MSEPKTGDELELTVAAAGKNCDVRLNGERFPGVQAFDIEMDVRDITRLSIRAIYPWPPIVMDGEIQKRTFRGYFVSTADMAAFKRWQEERAE